MGIIVGVGVVVEDNGAILLGQRLSGLFSGQWCLPGGKLDQGESVEECARRELFEETCLEALGPIAVISLSAEIEPEKDFHSITFGAVVRSIAGELGNPEPHKFSSWRWYRMTELPDSLFLPTRHVLQAYADSHNVHLSPRGADTMRPGEFRRLFRSEEGCS